MCIFIASLLLAPMPVIITLIVPNVSGLVERADKEITKGLNVFRKTKDSKASIISLPAFDGDMGISEDDFRATWTKLQALQPVACDKTGQVLYPSSKPAGAVLDVRSNHDAGFKALNSLDRSCSIRCTA